MGAVHSRRATRAPEMDASLGAPKNATAGASADAEALRRANLATSTLRGVAMRLPRRGAESFAVSLPNAIVAEDCPDPDQAKILSRKSSGGDEGGKRRVLSDVGARTDWLPAQLSTNKARSLDDDRPIT